MTRAKKAEAERLGRILDALREAQGPVKPGLAYGNPWELLVATVLSAQCTDVRVNLVTPGVFARYPTPAALAVADAAEVEEVIRSIGLFRNKARNLVALAGIVANEHHGEVPGTREELESLPGVGRKTASVVLSQGFEVPAFAVDTHIGRVCWRLGFASTRDPLEVERRVTALLAPAAWRESHLLLIRHGRVVCKAQRPRCPECPVEDWCPWPQKTVPGPASRVPHRTLNSELGT